MDTSLVFSIGSLTKTFTAVAPLHLVQTGVLSLDDTVGTLFPACSFYPSIRGDITLRELLQHTSGLYNYTDDSRYARDVLADLTAYWPPDSALHYVRLPYFEPGADFHYSNTNYILAGLIILTHTPETLLAEVFRRVILTPLGLSRTFLEPEEVPGFPEAHGHLDLTGDGIPEDISGLPRVSIYSSAWASGSMNATALDVARFLYGIWNHPLLPDSLLDAMTTPHPLSGYGLGIARTDWMGREMWGHAGNIRGYSALGFYVPSETLAIAVLSNEDHAPVAPVLQALLAFLYGTVDHGESRNPPGTFRVIPDRGQVIFEGSWKMPVRVAVLDPAGRVVWSRTFPPSGRLSVSLSAIQARVGMLVLRLRSGTWTWHHPLILLPGSRPILR